ncbi:LacI family DNA-binding transcriptional regulator [Kordia sp. YSTF-M3]|uniref:LacI family DNA-binding transcriptional regulator n=1 Tax=Kordia aestuariivivens TaxID=2759037 RepID=A0ABR7Q4A5_9FLAO|nr:LacI family DNA-binding transcriptional regulator [Kordia aestuariivivens]MBC8753380.1 LacI family DNA-binding transcriptional regulator [Kordia aestuariivivens]
MNVSQSAMTLKELSQLSGFSISTVSKALNNKFDISPTTRKVIQKIASKHEYVPNNYAVALRKKQTKTFAIIIPQINTPFYSCFLHNIEKVATKFGYRIMLFQSYEEHKREQECLKMINDGSVDGAIVLSSNCLKNITSRRKYQLPIECVQISEQFEETALKRECMTVFSNLLAAIH